MAKLKRTVIVGGASGTSGPVTFRFSRGQTFITERTTPTNPNTPAQQAARNRFSTCSRNYKGFDPAQVEAWDSYAANGIERDPVTGGPRFRDGINAYIGLGTKFLQVNPTGTPPNTPPTTAFSAPSVTITAQGDTGRITFTASGALPPNVRAELLVQPLANRNRKPQKNAYRTKAFASFGLGNLTFDVPVGPGFYAAAYRFVNAQTGQTTALQPIGVKQVQFALEGGNSKTGKKAA